jgi:hypothetical protein
MFATQTDPTGSNWYDHFPQSKSYC